MEGGKNEQNFNEISLEQKDQELHMDVLVFGSEMKESKKKLERSLRLPVIYTQTAVEAKGLTQHECDLQLNLHVTCGGIPVKEYAKQKRGVAGGHENIELRDEVERE